MNEGVIRDGWPFVWAAYTVTTLILTGYATSVFLRYRSCLLYTSDAADE